MPNYDDLAQALASEGAAFGVFPQMGSRRKTQDVEAAKNIPVDILRGRVAGLLGAIPDLLNMAGRSPMPTETFGDTQYEPTKQLPYGSEHYLKTLPLPPTTQTGRVANEMGALVPLDPRTVVKAGKPVISLLGNELARGMYGNEGSLANVIPTAMKPRFATEPIKNFESNFPTSITDRNEVKNVAEDFSNQFKQMGFDVTVDHSGSKAGASSYLRVSDPTTGRFLNKPIRISDHSKGAKELDANINVLNPQEDFAKITSILNDMRAKGDTLVFKQDKYAQELIANGVNPKTAYQKAKTEITGLPSLQIQDKVLPVTMHKLEEKTGNQIVNISPETFDKAFSKTDWQYVGKGGKGGIEGRYKGFENWLKDAKSMTASNVSVNKDGGIVFGDGRHRYAVLRDMGLDKLPISMDKESIENAKKFGYLSE